MGAVDTPQRDRGKGKKGHRRPKRRVGIRIDMTPMVDVAFLLLIFFMVTTVFRTPQALEINLPPEKDVKVEVAESKVVTVVVMGADRVFWKRGGKDVPWARTDVVGLEGVFKPFKGNKELVVLIKIDEKAPFHTMVDVIDELDLAGLTRFSLGKLSEDERKEVGSL